jgi:hypothetical protein
MKNRTRLVALVVLALLVAGGAPTLADGRISGVLTGAPTDSMTVWLEWEVDSLSGVEGFVLLRVFDPDVNPWELITPEPLPPASPGTFEDLDVVGETQYWYRLYAAMQFGPDVEVEGAVCTVTVSGTPIDPASWAAIKSLYR